MGYVYHYHSLSPGPTLSNSSWNLDSKDILIKKICGYYYCGRDLWNLVLDWGLLLACQLAVYSSM